MHKKWTVQSETEKKLVIVVVGHFSIFEKRRVLKKVPKKVCFRKIR